MINELLSWFPHHRKALDDKEYYEIILAEEKNTLTPGPSDSISEEKTEDLYFRLCRNEDVRRPTELAQLICAYVTNKSAFLKIAPLKMEVSNWEPFIVTYHDVMYDSEIDIIKQLAKPEVLYAY